MEIAKIYLKRGIRKIRSFWNPYFSKYYHEWRDKRIETILKHYGNDFFRGKTLLEVGCGYGDIGGFFSKLGADVTCSDCRKEHLKVVKEKYPSVKTMLVDLDQEFPFNHFDIVIHFGVLYHLGNPEKSIRQASAITDNLILETEVCNLDNPFGFISLKESGYDQAKNGIGVRPSTSYVERVLKDSKMNFIRLETKECNSGVHIYDWKSEETEKIKVGLRRMWFCKKQLD